MKEKPHYSYSQINMFLRCPRQYYFRYIEGKKIPPKSALTLGKSIHGGIEKNYSQKIGSHQDLPVGDICDVYSENFEFLKKETLWLPDENPGKIKDEGYGLIKTYQKEIAPSIQPATVEEKFTIEFPNVDYAFTGIMDLTTDNDFVIDHKTTSRTPNQKEIGKNLQLTAYATGFRYLRKKQEKQLRLDYIMRKREPEIMSITTERDEQDIHSFLKLIGYIHEAIQSGLFYPNINNRLCNEKWCGFWDLCQGGKKW